MKQRVLAVLLLCLFLPAASAGEPPPGPAKTDPNAPETGKDTPQEKPESKGTAEGDADEAEQAEEKPTDPRRGEVPLEAAPGWNASLIMDNKGVGVWTVKSYQVFEQLGCPEVVGLDDQGRCHVLMSYSGKWNPVSAVHDGSWLGGLTHGDVDPRRQGAELYVGSERGHVHQIVAYSQTALDTRLIAHIAGREVHTLVSGDLDPRTEGSEILAFTRPGGLYRLTPTGQHGAFEVVHIEDLKGRVRDAVVLPAAKGRPARIATVSRSGELALLRITRQGTQWETVYKAPMGKGRVALRPARAGTPVVLYTTHDDGRIMRHEEGPAGWKSEAIYLGPQGPRGVAAGRFDADPNVETVAVFGYSKKIELLRRDPKQKGWSVTTLFTAEGKGHWLATAEVDGRKETRELIASGFSGHVVLLSTKPGTGRKELAAER